MGSFIDAEWVLHYIASGTWVFRLENVRHKVYAGDMILLPPRLLHVVQSSSRPPLVQYVIHFNFSDKMPREPFSRIATLPVKSRVEAKELFHRIAREKNSSLPFHETIAAGLLVTMLGLYFRHTTAPPQRCQEEAELPSWAHISTAIECLHRRHSEKGLSLDAIAAASGLSKTYFCRTFRHSTGHSAMQYLKQLRLQQAEELLLRSRLNCTQIAEAVGYSGIHLFSRHFARHLGISPTTFRRRHAPHVSDF